jgi:hypothetical protein
MMKRYSHCLTVLAVLFGTTPLFAQAGDKGTDPTAAQLSELIRQVKDLRDSITDLKKRIEATPTEQTVDSQVRAALAGPAAELADLRRQIDQLQRDVASLKGLTPRVSNYPSGTGRIQLVNLYPAPMTVIVNDKSYRLAPAGQSGDRRLLENQPTGAFNYQVLGVQMDLVSRVLTPTETFTITVYPR